ncbi:S8 family serine peptidase [Myxococcota bacterium]|nr:S8 family serine peptidase [Myxococcota bacterium]
MKNGILGHVDAAGWLAGSTGRGVKVAVVDSGVDSTHPDLSGHVAGGVVLEERDGQIVAAPHDGIDVAGHGTACAGIIAGLAPEAEIYSVRVLKCTGTESDGTPRAGGKARVLLAGIDWAIEHCDVINVSSGLLVSRGAAHFESFHRMVEKAYYRDRIMVAAGENYEMPSFPSVFSNLIKVYWTEVDDPLKFFFKLKPRCFTEFLASGYYVRVPQPGGGHILEIGSSFAAPHLSAVAALILSKNPGLKPFEMKSLLYAMASEPPP